MFDQFGVVGDVGFHRSLDEQLQAKKHSPGCENQKAAPVDESAIQQKGFRESQGSGPQSTGHEGEYTGSEGAWVDRAKKSCAEVFS